MIRGNLSFYEAEIPMSTNWVQHFWLENKAQAENNLQTNFSNENHNMMVAPRRLTSLIHEELSGTIWRLIGRWQFLIQSSKLNFHNSKFESSMQFGFIERERTCLLGNMIDVAFSYEFLLIQVN